MDNIKVLKCIFIRNTIWKTRSLSNFKFHLFPPRGSLLDSKGRCDQNEEIKLTVQSWFSPNPPNLISPPLSSIHVVNLQLYILLSYLSFIVLLFQLFFPRLSIFGFTPRQRSEWIHNEPPTIWAQLKSLAHLFLCHTSEIKTATRREGWAR